MNREGAVTKVRIRRIFGGWMLAALLTLCACGARVAEPTVTDGVVNLMPGVRIELPGEISFPPVEKRGDARVVTVLAITETGVIYTLRANNVPGLTMERVEAENAELMSFLELVAFTSDGIRVEAQTGSPYYGMEYRYEEDGLFTLLRNIQIGDTLLAMEVQADSAAKIADAATVLDGLCIDK